MSNKIKIDAIHSKTIFQGNDNFRVSKWKVIEIQEDSTNKIIKGKVITIIGSIDIPVKNGQTYTFELKEENHPTHGLQYKIISVYEKIDFTDIKNQKAFLKQILTDFQIKSIYQTLPDPFKTIQEHDYESLKKVKGIGDETATKIIGRYEANKNKADLYARLDCYHLTDGERETFLKYFEKRLNKGLQILDNNPYDLEWIIRGWGFRTVDSIALRNEMGEKSPKRIENYILHLLKTTKNSGSSYTTAGELMSELYYEFGGKENIAEIMEDGRSNIAVAIENLKNKGKIVVEEGPNKFRRRIYLTSVMNLEKRIAYNLKRLLNAENTFNYSNWEEKIKELEKIQGFDFSEDQKKGIKLGLDSNVCLISGLAGTGKSSLVTGIVQVLSNYSYAQCALSGKAAARLQEVTGVSGQTIHRLLKYQGWSEEDEENSEEKIIGNCFGFNSDNPLPYDIIVLDEVSMVDGYLFNSLLEAIKTGAKLIMLGDLGQLESLGLLNVAADMHDSLLIPTVELTEIHRQAAKSGIITSASDIRNQRQLFSPSFEDEQKVGELKDMIFDIHIDSNECVDSVIEYFKKFYYGDLVNQDITKIQLISPIRERGESSVYQLNQEIQGLINPIMPDDPCADISKNSSHPQFIHERDKVLCLKNTYGIHYAYEDGETDVFNGWTGIVEKVDGDKVFVFFPMINASVVFSGKGKIKESLDLGYASTVHKLQGSDCPVVIGVLDYSTPPMMLTCQLVYTLLTRAKKYCVLVAQNGALARAIGNNFVSTKRTFLKELLDNNLSTYNN